MIQVYKLGQCVKIIKDNIVYTFPFNTLSFSFSNDEDENIDIQVAENKKVILSIPWSEIANTREGAIASLKNNLYI
jgi:hypothetical protein